MAEPWIELEEIRGQDQQDAEKLEPLWQAIFACQVEVPPHHEWASLKWGFNKAALLEEALERQRLFLESQYAAEGLLGIEPPDSRTLALRFVNRPGEGLLVAILGKIQAGSREEALERSGSYSRELIATFPYDYALVPACTRQDFIRMSGNDILDRAPTPESLAQVKRQEFPQQMARSSHALQGFWQSGPRAHEQVWRSLAASPAPLLLNISLRSTVLFDHERSRMITAAGETSTRVNIERMEQRLASMNMLFYLQVHLASTGNLSKDLFRTIGTSLTLTSKGQPHPGYQVVLPGMEEAQSWRRKIRDLDIIFSGSFLPVRRLSEVADLDEVFEVVRFPYSPPEKGFPDLTFTSTRMEPEKEN